MANNNKEIVKVLNVETKGSDVRVKTLRQEIAALNQVLKNTEQGSAEYNAAVQQIKNNQDLLSQAMKTTKTEAEALDGSYDALTNKLNELKKAWKATNDEVERSKLANEIKEVKDALTELDNSLGTFKTNSEDSLSTFKDEMSDAQDKIEPFKAKFESIQKISSGVASGFAAVQGTMALMGVENDKLGQTFIKLQSAMAIAQGIGGLGDLVEGMSQAKVAFSGAITSVKAFITSLRGMKLAMAATGIGAALVLVGMLAKAFMDLAEATDKAKEAKERLDKIESKAEFDQKKKRVELTQAETKAYNEYAEDLKKANGNKTKIEEAELKLKKKLREASDEYYNNELDNLNKLQKEQEKQLKIEEKRLEEKKNKRAIFDKTQETQPYYTKPINEFLYTKLGSGNSKEDIQEQEKSIDELKNKIVKTKQDIADAKRAISDNEVEAAQETSDKLVGISDSTNAQLKENAEKAKEFAKSTLASYASNVDLTLNNIKTNVEYNLKSFDKLTSWTEESRAKAKKKSEDKYQIPGLELDGKEVEGEINVVEAVLVNSYQNQLALLDKKQQDEIALIKNNKEAIKEIEKEYGVDILSILAQQHQAEKDVLSQQYNEKLENYKEYLKNRQEAYINTRMGILSDKLYDLEVKKDKDLYENDDTYGYKQAENKEEKSNKWRLLDKEKYWDELDTKPEEIEKERITKENDILDEEHNKKIGYLNEEMSLMEARFGAEAKNTDAYKELVRQKEEADNNYNNTKKENDKKIDALDAEIDKKKVARKKFTANAIMDIASSMFGSLSSILGEESKAGKAFAVAQATIDTYKAANSAYASMAGIPVVGPGLGAAAAAAAVLAGIANVKKILEVPDDGKETSTPSSSNVSQSIVRPNISLSDTIPTQLTQNLMTDTELSELNKPTRVYVTETDISDTMNKVEVTENNASF